MRFSTSSANQPISVRKSVSNCCSRRRRQTASRLLNRVFQIVAFVVAAAAEINTMMGSSRIGVFGFVHSSTRVGLHRHSIPTANKLTTTRITRRFTSPTPTSLNSTQQPTTASESESAVVMEGTTKADTTTPYATASFSSIPSSSYLDSLNVFDRLCDLQTPEGRCVGLKLKDHLIQKHPDSLDVESIVGNSSHWIYSVLHPEEIEYGVEELGSSKSRRETFFIGRIAVREALGILQEPLVEQQQQLDSPNSSNATATATTTTSTTMNGMMIPAILKDEHGRPTMPKGWLGSISHKGTAGVGIVARDETFSSPDDPPKVGIGTDLERTTNSRRNIARRVLTENEISSLGQVEGVTNEEEVMLRFSLKECIYKSVHPLICQYVGFQEAEVTPFSDGTATVSWNLKSGADLRLGEVKAQWQRLEGGEFFLSTSSASLLEVEE